MKKELIIENVKDFNLEHIFDCGQCFRWRELEDGTWVGIAGKKIARMDYLPKEKRLTITEFGLSKKKADPLFWENYLDLGRDYGSIKRKLSKNDPVIKTAINEGEGIRILNQDLWETIVSFIISQNNNIPRIKGCIERLADSLGDDIPLGSKGEEETLSALGLVPKSIPSPKRLAVLKEKDLESVRLGYRAKYLIKSANEVLERGLPKSYEEVLALTGVGPKVANCIELFGLHETDSFPIDVWVKRVMKVMYGFDEKDVKGMDAFARKTFGELSGIAQQYLFYYIRGLEQGE